MYWVDAVVFGLYFVAMIGVGVYFLTRNKSATDYYVGGREMGTGHVGLSIVATDVGGGFSIGLGGLGFTMGLSGSWLLFTGLIGAILSGTFLVPYLHRHTELRTAMTFPDLFRVRFGKGAAFIAAFISAVGYLGFTSSQILAGAKLATATFPDLSFNTILILMGATVVGYTALGGIKAVIYTDTIQWVVLLSGLAFVGIPFGVSAVGGIDEIRALLPAEMMSMTNVSWQTIVRWLVTIVPIWFVGMTLYQRIYACRDEKSARRAFYMAGLFEWPVMAFLGVGMGMIARVAAMKGLIGPEMASGNAMDPEQGLPLMLNTVLPVGLMGLIMSAYFSAILSTADSCLMASSANTLADILQRVWPRRFVAKRMLRHSIGVTFLLGAIAIALATIMTSVLDLMLMSYAFMVSGLFVPVVAALVQRRPNQAAAVAAMLLGGMVTISLTLLKISPLSLDANVFGISASALAYVVVSRITTGKNAGPLERSNDV
ncbi:MAG: sodium:solute symporter family protein [Deltaproteobacteria bacterium]|nr:sodium:solute symporter family protein [Deltaproteobacteria bacterium]